MLMPHSAFLERHFGFSTDDMLGAYDTISARIGQSLAHAQSVMHEFLASYMEFSKSRRPGEHTSVEALAKEFRSRPDGVETAAALNARLDTINWEPFKLPDDIAVPGRLLQELSCRFGGNADFMRTPGYPGWPANSSIVTRRPLVEHDGRYYCFLPQLLQRNAIAIAEAIIRETDQAYFERQYHQTRHRVVNDLALRYLQLLLPNARVAPNLRYQHEDQLGETDGLVLYDDHLIVIETKAGTFHMAARRGAPGQIRTDAQSLILDAYAQGEKLVQYVRNAAMPVFTSEDGSEVTLIDPARRPSSCYIMNVTLESLGMLGTRPTSTAELGLGQRQLPMWTVCIADLRAITDMNEFPSAFLYYLDRRADAEQYRQFRTSDELDVLMYFFREGLNLDPATHGQFHAIMFSGFTNELDRYYNWQDGLVDSAHRPTLQIPRSIKDIIRAIETVAQPGFSHATKLLLGMGHQNLAEVAKGLKELRKRLALDGQPHNAHAAAPGAGVTIVMSSEHTPEVLNRHRQLSYIYMHEARVPKWLLVHLHVGHDGVERVSWEMLHSGDVPDDNLAEASAILAAERRRRFQGTGRNDPCPCGSGRKFKKCCGRG
jgi:hypothetical protein